MALDAFLSVDSMLIYLVLFSGWFFHQLLPNATLLILRCVFSSLSSFRNTRFSLHIHFVLCFIFWHTLPVASRLNVMLKVHMLRCIKRSFYQTNNIHTYVALHTHIHLQGMNRMPWNDVKWNIFHFLVEVHTETPRLCFKRYILWQ